MGGRPTTFRPLHPGASKGFKFSRRHAADKIKKWGNAPDPTWQEMGGFFEGWAKTHRGGLLPRFLGPTPGGTSKFSGGHREGPPRCSIRISAVGRALRRRGNVSLPSKSSPSRPAKWFGTPIPAVFLSGGGAQRHARPLGGQNDPLFSWYGQARVGRRRAQQRIAGAHVVWAGHFGPEPIMETEKLRGQGGLGPDSRGHYGPHKPPGPGPAA